MAQIAAIEPEDVEDVRTLEERLEAFAGSLQREATRRVGRRSGIETRWIEDLQQYHGRYDQNTLNQIKKNGGSEVFLNMTRPKTDLMSARLWELLFPTDDKNWGISPTPVPELTEEAQLAIEAAEKNEKQAAKLQEEADSLQQVGPEDDVAAREAQFAQVEGQRVQAANAARAARSKADQLQAILDEANKRADAMEREIDDQLAESGYAIECRKVIDDACQIGFGVLKGPVAGDKPRKKWLRSEDGTYMLQREFDPRRPMAHWVDPWSFFPDPDAPCIENSVGFYERHLWTKQDMRKFAKRPSVNQDAVREIMRQGPSAGKDTAYLSQLFEITGEKDVNLNDRFTVWEYTGPVDGEDIRLLVEAFEPDATADLDAEIDELQEIGVKVWFCSGKVLKFDYTPLDSGDPIYSVFSVAEDSASVYGYGVPYLMRDPQAVINGATRGMMDNASTIVGPQIGINKRLVEPENGSYKLEPKKVWLVKDGANDIKQAMSTFDIPSQQQEFANIIEFARAAIDEVTSMPQIAQGEMGPTPQQTASGMAMLMNAANVTFRRVVKMFDDTITVPTIRRFYDWNMQFSTKEEIKGDFEVDARGSSVLLVREMQANNLLVAMQIPQVAELIAIRDDGLGLAKMLFKSLMLDPDEILPTEDEIEKARQNVQADPEMQKMQEEAALKREEIDARIQESSARVAVAEMNANARLQEAQINLEAEMIKLAETRNMQLEDLQAKLQISRNAAQAAIEKTRIDTQSAERKLASEAAMKMRTGDSAGGSV